METVVIVGSGLVGKSWAMLFASKGHQVRLYDSFPEAVDKAPGEIEEMMRNFESKGFLRGDLTADEQIKLIKGYKDLDEALVGATYVQECAPETLELKTKVWHILNESLKTVGNSTAVLGSSSSTIQHSEFCPSELEVSQRSLIVHPVNPPYFVSLVELCPSAATNDDVTKKVRNLMESIGMKPVVINKEIPGFALNRIQYAILNETWKLVEEGYLTVADADSVMRDGLAPRYVFMGPLETAQLNAFGFVDYCTRYGDGIKKVSETMTRIPHMTAESCLHIDTQLQEMTKDEDLGQRRKWRDENLALLAKFKNNLQL